MKFMKIGFCVIVVGTMVLLGLNHVAKTVNKAKSGLEMIIQDKIDGKF